MARVFVTIWSMQQQLILFGLVIDEILSDVVVVLKELWCPD